jgi:hypothetical protein
MSYENTQCVCGGRKLTDTMLCADCEKAVEGTFDRREMENPAATWEQRRNAAIRCLAVARRRNPSLPLTYACR